MGSIQQTMHDIHTPYTSPSLPSGYLQQNLWCEPISNAYKNWITHFWNMYDHCSCLTTWSDHNIFDLTSSHFDSYCTLMSHNHDWSPPVLPLCHCTYAPACYWIMMGRSLELSPVLNPFLRNHTTFMMRCLMHLPILTWHTFMVMVVYWKMMCPLPQTQKN